MKAIHSALAAALLVAMASCGHRTDNAEQDTARTTDVTPMNYAGGADSPVAVVDNRIIPVDDYGTIVDFYADWCPPCKKLKPIFEQFKAKYDGKLNFVSIDIDQQQNLASSYSITNIPTLLFISADGKELGRMVGLHSPEEIEARMASYFPEEMK